MKLDHDCVRDLMFYLEEKLEYGVKVSLNQGDDLSNYQAHDLLYAAERLDEAGFINCTITKYYGTSIPDIEIKSITWSGHAYLDNIRSDTVWKPTKDVISKLGSVSLGMASQIASNIITQMISKQLGM